MDGVTLIPGHADASATRPYAEARMASGDTAQGHYSEFLRARLRPLRSGF